MPTHANSVLRQVEAELAAARDQLVTTQQAILDRVAEVRDFFEQRTDSFVDLARHYLPELTQQNIDNAWSEVRGEIEDLLLRKNDQKRRLNHQLAELESQERKLRFEVNEIREKAEQEGRVLSCRLGNYRKRLREDPEILRCSEAINQTDKQIELALAQLEFAEDEARRKLPDYEECALFDYLRERQFGTPAYKERGIERSWDRWVAKLIDFRDARKSFELLKDTPDLMKDLIRDKQSRYLQLLEQLEMAQKNVKTVFGVEKQTKIWHDLCDQAGQQEQELEHVRRATTELHDRIGELDDVDGQYYREAIEIYHKFLTELEPDVLKVYASCTKSPVDDEICARLRNIQKDIDSAQKRSAEQKRAVIAREKYVDALHDLGTRLRSYLYRMPATVLVYGDLDLPSLLSRMHRRDLSVNDVWLTLRESMVKPRSESATMPSRPRSLTPTASKISPLDACYTAVSEQISRVATNDRKVDPTHIVSVGVPVSNTPDETHAGFTTLAVCASGDEAGFLVSHLESQSMASFVRTQQGDTVYAGRDFESDEFHVLVDSRKYSDAAKLMLELQKKFSDAWECPKCRNRVDSGRAVCWSCGRERTLENFVGDHPDAANHSARR